MLRKLPDQSSFYKYEHSVSQLHLPKMIADELYKQSKTQRGWQSVSFAQAEEDDASTDQILGTSLKSWLVAVCSGMLLGVIAVFIEICTQFVVSIRIGVCRDFFWLSAPICCLFDAGGECGTFATWGAMLAGPNGREAGLISLVLYAALSCGAACTAALLCATFSAFAAGGGIIEVKTIVSGEILNCYLGPPTLAIKALGVCMSTGSGLVVGKEGPFVHIGSCVCDLVAKLFRVRDSDTHRDLIAAGAAGGVAVAFGAPVGGAIFAIEEISGQFQYQAMMQSLLVGTVGVLVVKAADMFHNHRIVQFSINYTYGWEWFEFPLFIIVGFVGGALGSIFIYFNGRWNKMKQRLNVHQWKVTEVFLLTLLSAVLNYNIPHCKGSMIELLTDLFQHCGGNSVALCKINESTAMMQTLIAGITKQFLFIITIGVQLPSGLLVPSLCIGALFGRSLGSFFHIIIYNFTDTFLFSSCKNSDICVIPGVYAILGAAAMLCGVTRMTISLTVIMFELTGGLTYLVPTVISILTAKYTAEHLFKMPSIYEIGISVNNLPIFEKNDIYEGNEVIQFIATSHLIILYHEETLESLWEKLFVQCPNPPPTGYPIVDNSLGNNTFIGYIERKDLALSLGVAPIENNLDDYSTSENSIEMTNLAESQLSMQETNVYNASFSSPYNSKHNSPIRQRQTIVRFTKATKEYSNNTKSVNQDHIIDLSKSVYQPLITVDPTEKISSISHLFQRLRLTYLILCTNGEFKGLVHRSDLINFIRSNRDH